MRNFKNVQKAKQKELENIFPELLKLYSDENTDTYKKTTVCVFDHWLSNDEAIKEIDKLSNKKEQEHNRKLHSFCVALAKSTECYLVKLLGKKKETISFKKFTNEIGLKNTLVPEHHYVSDTFRFVLALPELEVVYFEGCDFTHHVYYKNETNMQSISNLVTEHGLFLLK